MSRFRRKGTYNLQFYQSSHGIKIAIITVMKKLNLFLVPLFLLNITLHFYNPANVGKERGSIISASRKRIYFNQSFWVLKLRNMYGKIIKVELGPCEFMQGFSPEVGDALEVEGSFLSVAKQPIVIARKITWKGRTWILRTKEGFPLWRKKGK